MLVYCIKLIETFERYSCDKYVNEVEARKERIAIHIKSWITVRTTWYN